MENDEAERSERREMWRWNETDRCGSQRLFLLFLLSFSLRFHFIERNIKCTESAILLVLNLKHFHPFDGMGGSCNWHFIIYLFIHSFNESNNNVVKRRRCRRRLSSPKYPFWKIHGRCITNWKKQWMKTEIWKWWRKIHLFWVALSTRVRLDMRCAPLERIAKCVLESRNDKW